MSIASGTATTRSKMKRTRCGASGECLHRVIICIFLLMACVATACSEDLYSMEKVKAQPGADFPSSLVSAVNPEGFRVFTHMDKQKLVICEIFWARAIHGQEVRDKSAKLLYPALRQGDFLGVIHFAITQRYVREYRTQIFKPGYYTMRYVLSPQGEAGKDPVDFALLSPVALDHNPARLVPRDIMLQRGRATSHTKRPAVMSLPETDPDQPYPSLTTDDEGTSTLQVKLRLNPHQRVTPQELSLALTVITAIPEDLGD